MDTFKNTNIVRNNVIGDIEFLINGHIILGVEEILGGLYLFLELYNVCKVNVTLEIEPQLEWCSYFL